MKVLTIEREFFERFRDLPIKDKEHLVGVLVDCTAQWVERDAAEENEHLLQLIPYVMVTNNNHEIFGYERLGGDARLVGKTSFGIGGHVEENVDGVTPEMEAVQVAAYREMTEELDIEDWVEWTMRPSRPDYPFPVTGSDVILWTGEFILRNDTPVSRVHLGFPMVCNVGHREVKVRETKNMSGRFYTRAEIVKLPKENVEGWSLPVLDYYLEHTLGAQPIPYSEELHGSRRRR